MEWCLRHSLETDVPRQRFCQCPLSVLLAAQACTVLCWGCLNPDALSYHDLAEDLEVSAPVACESLMKTAFHLLKEGTHQVYVKYPPEFDCRSAACKTNLVCSASSESMVSKFAPAISL